MCPKGEHQNRDRHCQLALKSKMQLRYTSSTEVAEIPLLAIFWQQGVVWGALLNNFLVLLQATFEL